MDLSEMSFPIAHPTHWYHWNDPFAFTKALIPDGIPQYSKPSQDILNTCSEMGITYQSVPSAKYLGWGPMGCGVCSWWLKSKLGCRRWGWTDMRSWARLQGGQHQQPGSDTTGHCNPCQEPTGKPQRLGLWMSAQSYALPGRCRDDEEKNPGLSFPHSNPLSSPMAHTYAQFAGDAVCWQHAEKRRKPSNFSAALHYFFCCSQPHKQHTG